MNSSPIRRKVDRAGNLCELRLINGMAAKAPEVTFVQLQKTPVRQYELKVGKILKVQTVESPPGKALASVKLLAGTIHHWSRKDGAFAPAIKAHDPDVIVLDEHRANGSVGLVERPRLFGWPHLTASRVTGRTNGVAIVSKEPLEAKPSPLVGQGSTVGG